MLTEDYLIRMLNLAIAALLKIAGLKKDGDYHDALQLIDITLEQLVGLRSNLIKHLEDERFYFVLTRNEQLDTRRLAVIADLFKEEGDIYAAQNRPADSLDDYNRALRFYLEVFFNLPDEERGEISPKIETLLKTLPLSSLRTDALWPLAGYYEEISNYPKAETVLLALVEFPEVRAAVLPELVAFYQRLVTLPPSTGFTPQQLQEKLNYWISQS